MIVVHVGEKCGNMTTHKPLEEGCVGVCEEVFFVQRRELLRGKRLNFVLIHLSPGPAAMRVISRANGS